MGWPLTNPCAVSVTTPGVALVIVTVADNVSTPNEISVGKVIALQPLAVDLCITLAVPPALSRKA